MKNKRRVRADLQAQARMSLDIVTGAQNLATLSPQDLFDRERPEDMRAMFKLARKWHKEHWFVEQALKLQKAFLNYGLRLTAEDDRGRAQLKKFMADPRKKGALLRYIHTVWTEWLLQDNVVSFWRSEVTPYLLLGETCTYSDAMGIEKLKVDLGYKKGQLEGSGLSAEEIKRYTSREVTLSEDFDEYFEVLTRAPRGGGFAVPRLYRVFRVLSQCESMEVGETMLAYAGRLVVRMHRMGWEVKAGGNLAKQSEYLWKRERAKAIKDYFVGRQGYAETTGQFDHKIDIHWVDPKLYESRKWDTIISRLLWWAGPVGFMMMAKSASPFLLQMLKSDAEQDRPMVGAHLESVINQGFGIGAPIRVRWSNRCFLDQRLAWEMVKSLMQQGPLSLQTSLEQADFDPREEAERKTCESEPARDAELLPKFDPNHGKRPSEPAGRRVGVKDTVPRE